ncbi:sulfite exporter TauE/SafE family protein [Roseovarius pelagicus]|uniref:Probable membrane transporter protein n=1 Tax=Roseovarius pelagicus TaxID=2980108 RepID=A0ABY6DEI1_9RHOB|nr:sulfite exporter TauE/SafE family protein [Roseovarius pelagicus]UXX84469.1 sulfite exporter TauE/SafE family protein [Roseovarius pelagicus]
MEIFTAPVSVGPDAMIIWVFALTVTLFAGMIKGLVGFALPMVMISCLGSVMAPELALAGVILPTLVTNIWQALRQGLGAAWQSVRRFRLFLMSAAAMLVAAAQLVPLLPSSALYLLIGVPVTLYAAMTLLGRGLRLPPNPGPRLEVGIGLLTGAMGGLTAVWGPPTVAMLTAQGTEKREQMRVQGVIYGSGAILLAMAHFGSGILRAETMPFSLAMVPPALLGMWMGFAIQDRIDQAVFRRVTLFVLLVAGVNLLRRGVMLV